MKVTKEKYLNARQLLLADRGKRIIDVEQNVTNKLQKIILENAELLKSDFDLSSELYPFWANYAPLQRGRQPVGDSIPWTEVGQTSLSSNLNRFVVKSDQFNNVQFPGLPSGGDFRFLIDEAFVHLDVKVTGPRDVKDEVVASRNQVSGTGKGFDDNGIINDLVEVVSPRTRQSFQPELPPFYILNGKTYPCITMFIKGIYKIIEPGNQPLDYLELVTVPNGLLLFDGPKYSEVYPELIRPGKDDYRVTEHLRRRRVKLNPLAEIASWRCTQFKYDENRKKWSMRPRSG
jgi:hypothetical protein